MTHDNFSMTKTHVLVVQIDIKKNMCCDEIGLSMCLKSIYYSRFKSEHDGECLCHMWSF